MMGNNQAKKLAALQFNDERDYKEWLRKHTIGQRIIPSARSNRGKQTLLISALAITEKFRVAR